MPMLRNPETADVLYFTAELSADWEDTVEVSANPVPLSDPAQTHKERKPRTYTLRLVCSDAPLQKDLPPGGAQPPGERWDSAVEAWLRRNLMARLDYISPSTGLVQGVDITSVRRGRNGSVMSTTYDINLTQARFAEAQTVRLPPPRRQKKPTTNPPEDKGPAPTEQAPPKLQSADARIYKGVVTDRKETLQYRLLPQNWAVGESSAGPSALEAEQLDAESLSSNYQFAGPYSRYVRGK